MDYKHAVINQYHFDELPEPTQEALYAAAAAEKLNDIFGWLLGAQKGNLANNRKSTVGRVYTLGVVLGRYTLQEAADQAGINISAIKKHKANFCQVFGVEKKRGQVVKEK